MYDYEKGSSEKKEYLDDKNIKGVTGVGRYGYKCSYMGYPPLRRCEIGKSARVRGSKQVCSTGMLCVVCDSFWNHGI